MRPVPDLSSMQHSLRALTIVGLTAAAGCASTTSSVPSTAASTTTPPTVPAPAANARLGRGDSADDQRWADSVLRTLSLRDKAAQMVWVWTLGDYTADDAPAWTNIEKVIREQKLGGAIVSVGGPVDIAAKTNALQRAAALPLLLGADLETGAAFRARGGWFLPNAIELGGATSFPYQMGLGATRDSTLAYEMGRVTAIEGRCSM